MKIKGIIRLINRAGNNTMPGDTHLSPWGKWDTFEGGKSILYLTSRAGFIRFKALRLAVSVKFKSQQH